MARDISVFSRPSSDVLLPPGSWPNIRIHSRSGAANAV
jgi:hypothetical protein